MPPSTAPAPPAPSRRLYIRRIDGPMNPNVASVPSWESIMNQKPSKMSAAGQANPTAGSSPDPLSRPLSAQSNASSDFGMGEEPGKRRWNLLKSFLPTAKTFARSNGNSNSSSRDSSPDARPAAPSPLSNTINAQDVKSGNVMQATTVTTAAQEKDKLPTPIPMCFRFSLDPVRPEDRSRLIGNLRLAPPRLPAPAQMYLQAHQASEARIAIHERAKVSARQDDSTPGNERQDAVQKQAQVLPGNANPVIGQFPRSFPFSSSQDQQASSKLSFNTLNQPRVNVPVKPEGAAAKSSTYAGRALAEWGLLVNECQNFFDRRRAEGVPGNRWVETPMLRCA
jgi:hypothetical protein